VTTDPVPVPKRAFPKKKQPFSLRVLEDWIRTLALEQDEDANRLRRSVSFMVVSAVLARLTETDGTPLFVLKGGVAMQLRFGIRARLSKDYDAAFRREIDQLEAILAQAPSHPIGRFGIHALGKPEPIGPTGALRQTLQVTFDGKGWGKIAFEVSKAEGHSADPAGIDYLASEPNFSVFGLEPLGEVACMPISYQIAQKLHACTEILDNRDNERFADLLDLQLLEELIDDWWAVRVACEEVFRLRAKHAWPPSITIHPAWPDAYRALAVENKFPVEDVQVAKANLAAMVSRIAASIDESE
jgi:hypothetical protein